MTQQHQIVAVVKDRKDLWTKAMTRAYQLFQKADTFAGLFRTYKPLREDEAALPTETKRPMSTIDNLINELKAPMLAAFDTVRTQDEGNRSAMANVEIEGKVLLANVPATHLLFLEKQLQGLLTMAEAIPTLSGEDNWQLNAGTGLYNSDAHESMRTRKVSKPLVLYEATKDHPAQCQVLTEDVPVGMFNAVKTSGALPKARKDEIVGNVRQLLEAVKRARQEANSQEVENVYEGKILFEFIFG